MSKKIIIVVILIIGVFSLVKLGDFYLTEKKSSDIGKNKPQVQKQVEEITVNPALYQLSLSEIFDHHIDLTKLDPKKTVSIIMTGDIIPARLVNNETVSLDNFNYPYLKVATFLRNADLTMTNLESPLFTGCPVTTTGMTFCGDPRNVQGLVYGGIDVASTANNHSGNYGDMGLTSTETLLKANGIAPVGNGLVANKEIKGVKFAILAYNGVGQAFDMTKIASDIKAAKKTADVVIIIPHWGKEYVRTPQAAPGIAPDDPKVISHEMIDDGADIILGNHPHWYQGVEIYKNKLIVYAHGNFIFDQTWSVETTQGVIGKYTFYNGKLVDATFTPIQISNTSQPDFMNQTNASQALATMKANSW